MKQLLKSTLLYLLGPRPSIAQRKEALRSLRSHKCPLCGGNKRFGFTACHDCYLKLPKRMKTRLNMVLRRGYVFAYHDMIERFKSV
jgi:hypothetical protein